MTPVPMPAALLAEIRQRDEQEGLYSSYSGQEVQDARCDRRALLAEMDRLTRLTAECTCGATYATHEGPAPDCPVHGAVRALHEAEAALTQARAEVDRLKAEVMDLRDMWDGMP